MHSHRTTQSRKIICSYITAIKLMLLMPQLMLLIPLLSATAFCESAKVDAEVFVLDTVVVTSEKIEEYIRNHPQSVKVVERKEIVARNLSSVEEVLKTMSGVEVYSTPGIGSRISIRGSGRSSGLLVLLNGRALNSNQYGSQDLNSIPVDSIKSVTVFKPPVPVWLGSGGSDGAINIVTSIEKERGDKKKKRSTAKFAGGSYGYGEGSLSHQRAFAGGEALLSATATHRDGSRANSDRTDGAFAVNWNLDRKDGTGYEVSGRCYRAEYGSPGPLDNLTPDARQEYQKASIDTKYSGFIGETGTLAATLYSDSVSLEDQSQTGVTSDLDDLKVGMKIDTAWSQDDGDWELRVGAGSEWDQFDHTISGEHHRFQNGISSQYDLRLGPFTPTIGIRGDLTDDFGFTPGFVTGIGWGVTKKCIIKLKGGYTVNVPKFEQLFQTTHGSSDQTRGNPDLDEESVWSYDLGVEYTFSKNRLIELTLFRADTSDLITYERGTDLIYRPVNLDSVWRQGVDLTGKYAWRNGFTAETSLTLQDSADKDSGKELSYTPNIKVKSTLSYTIEQLKTRLEGTLRYEGSRFSQLENLPGQKLDEYVVAGAKVTQPFMVGEIAADGYLKVDNIFDTSYESHIGYPADGAVVIAGVQLKF